MPGSVVVVRPQTRYLFSRKLLKANSLKFSPARDDFSIFFSGLECVDFRRGCLDGHEPRVFTVASRRASNL